MKKRLLATLLAAAMTVTLAAGCGTPGSKKSSSDSEGKVFHYATQTEPTTLDPTKGQGIQDNEIQHAITESLVRNTAGEISEGIAESWDVSEDQTTYTFHLRDDAKWSDGEPITAADFVYSWQRLLNPETASPYAFIGEYIKNGLAVEKGEMDPSQLAVKAIDDTTLEVVLEHPTPYFLSLIGSSGQFAPLRQDIVEEYGADFAADAEKNVYSGPFKMVSSANNEWVFEKNENYWNTDAINLDKVVLTYVQNTDTQLAMYEDGELDYVLIPTAYVPDYEGKDQVVKNGNVDYFYINHECDNPALLNKNFRLALNYALNRNDYITLAVNDTYAPSNRLVFSGLSGIETTYGEEYPVESYPMEGDEATAKSYLETAMSELGVSNPSDISVEITTTDAESSKKIAEVCQELWQNALGITVTIRQVTYSEIYGTVLPGGDYEIGYGGWGSDYDDPYSYLELFKGDSSYNYGNYNNPEVTELLTATQTETDVKARMDMLAQAEQIILDEGAFVPLQEREIHYLMDDDVKGVEFYYCSVNIDWVYADITE